ncbi:P27 family phage terminase small subunit [Sphingomonas sp. CFBP 13733]|uniref:P27 family phage terminase small subunit n=1 Tax=Sphingomonas sp. CFBP 13733 TaxID=2775291 RepID=UPI001785BAA1|nr:P27 family phage terminase small subunit [Sphingomonas sp. CFBP 13733]MBD8641126.1 P27 family phage terminase small subunit [Sphingomonas sp. CFBP 13733]
MTKPAAKPATKPARAPRAPRKSRAKPVAAPVVSAPIAPVDNGIVATPDWSLLLTDPSEQRVAGEHWHRIAGEMRDREILSPSNGHALQRLVLAYLVYDRCSNAVALSGIVDAPKADNPKAIARLSIHYKAMREAENTAERLEARLGISPGQRGKVAKVAKKRERTAGADRFLGPAG